MKTKTERTKQQQDPTSVGWKCRWNKEKKARWLHEFRDKKKT